jgi:hypothetical protein
VKICQAIDTKTLAYIITMNAALNIFLSLLSTFVRPTNNDASSNRISFSLNYLTVLSHNMAPPRPKTVMPIDNGWPLIGIRRMDLMP